MKKNILRAVAILLSLYIIIFILGVGIGIVDSMISRDVDIPNPLYMILGAYLGLLLLGRLKWFDVKSLNFKQVIWPLIIIIAIINFSAFIIRLVLHPEIISSGTGMTTSDINAYKIGFITGASIVATIFDSVYYVIGYFIYNFLGKKSAIAKQESASAAPTSVSTPATTSTQSATKSTASAAVVPQVPSDTTIEAKENENTM